MADIILTPSAAARVAAIAKQQRKPAILRLAVEGGGCSGFQYRFGLADEIEGDDVSVEQDGVKLVVDAVSLDLVRGSAVDFVEDLGGSAFKVTNPNARSEEHTSELQSLMRSSYAVFCLKKTKICSNTVAHTTQRTHELDHP